MTGDDDLIERYIDFSPTDRAEARLRDSGIHVWAIVGQWQVEHHNPEIVAQAYDIPLSAVEAALAYHCRNKQYIDARLLLNSA